MLSSRRSQRYSCTRYSPSSIYFQSLARPSIFQAQHRREVLNDRDFFKIGALIRHNALIDAMPNWALPRFAAFLHHASLTAQGQTRWCHRFMLDRKKVIWDAIWNLADKLCNAVLEGQAIIRDIDFTIRQQKNRDFTPNPSIERIIDCIMKRIDASAPMKPHCKWFRLCLHWVTYNEQLRAAETKVTRSIANSLEQTISKLHPAGQILIREFICTRNLLSKTSSADPTAKLLERGLGFVPRPKTLTVISNVIAHAARNTHLLEHLPGHPGASSATAMLYHEKLKNLCQNIIIPDNLPQDERTALTEAINNTDYVFVPTDKTNKTLAIKRNIIGAAIESFLEAGRGKTFDLFDDPITFGIALNESKNNTRSLLNVLLHEVKHVPFANCYKGTPDLVHGVRFSKGVPAIEKMIKVLAHEYDYIPSYGPLKPHIKDHKMKTEIHIALQQLEEKMNLLGRNFMKDDPKALPLRLTHKATCGPSSAIAEIIAPILERLASLCQLSLTQASADVAEFLFKHKFLKKPAFAARLVCGSFRD